MRSHTEGGEGCRRGLTRVRNRRSIAILTSATSVMLLAGVAFAQVGSMAPRAPELETRTYGEVSGLSTATDRSSAPGTPIQAGTALTPDGRRALIVEHPADGDRFGGEALTVRGSAPAHWTVELGSMTTVVDGDGGWEMTVVLAPGANLIAVRAISPNGSDQLDVGVTAHYDVAGSKTMAPSGGVQSPDDSAVASDETFTANHKYEQHHAPSDVLWGTGTPGDTVSAVSLYGDASTTVNDDGLWDLYIRFVDAPEGIPFEIIVESGAGGAAAFSFTWVSADDDVTRRSWSMRGRDPWSAPSLPPSGEEHADRITGWNPSAEPDLGSDRADWRRDWRTGGGDGDGDDGGHLGWQERTDRENHHDRTWRRDGEGSSQDDVTGPDGDHHDGVTGGPTSPSEGGDSPAMPRTQPRREPHGSPGSH